MGSFFLTLISQIGLKAILAALSTLLTGGLVTLFLHERKKAKDAKEEIAKLKHNLELEGKHYDEEKKKLEQDREKMEKEYKQKDQEWIDERSRLKNDLENTKESAENAKYATLTVASLTEILNLETKQAKLKGTQWFKKDIKGVFPITKTIKKRGLFKKNEEITEYYYDYYVGVKQYSLNLFCSVNLKDVKVRKDSDGNIKIYGLALSDPTYNDDDYKSIYWTVLRYQAKLIKDENGKEYRKPDESKCRDVKEEYNEKQGDERTAWDCKKQELEDEIKQDFKRRFKVKKEEIEEKKEEEIKENYDFLYDAAKKQAQMFLKGVFAPYVDCGKEIRFIDEPEDPSSVKTLQDFCSQTKILEWHK